ncbi:MAG: hypothetical protein APF76_10920 [Desulfitibacter sp. BRH_c19]|nr:MAG: hypothetical protein APF76_10920 [Desulfitibacter sp. BRH_c19]
MIEGNILRTVISLRNMIAEMNRKNIELKRITKTSSILLMSGLSANSIPEHIVKRCLDEQHEDGGWAGIGDTIWNAFFLKQLGYSNFKDNIKRALNFMGNHRNKEGLWGRSNRDISRIPVSGLYFYLLPEAAESTELRLLEELWYEEFGGITYKAAYTLMAFKKKDYMPVNPQLIDDTVKWLVENQEADGGFSPWKAHPVDSDVFCTAIATIGLLQYRERVDTKVFKRSYEWLHRNQLKNGIWKYHEIEDGTSWGLYAMVHLIDYFKTIKWRVSNG